jgi:RNA polymerase sigma factor (sigma-70 family)
VTHADLSEAERAVVERTLAGAGGDEGGSDSREAMRELLNKLIGGLKPDQQVVIRLLDLEERSVREVSELTGFSESKVKVTAMRARRKLSELLQQLEGTTRDPAAAAR